MTLRVRTLLIKVHDVGPPVHCPVYLAARAGSKDFGGSCQHQGDGAGDPLKRSFNPVP